MAAQNRKKMNITDTPPTPDALSQIPDPAHRMTRTAAEYYWKLCQHLLDNGRLDGITATYCRILAEDLAAAADDPDYFQLWKHGRAGAFLQLVCKMKNIPLETVERIECSGFEKSIEYLAGEIGLSIIEVWEITR